MSASRAQLRRSYRAAPTRCLEALRWSSESWATLGRSIGGAKAEDAAPCSARIRAPCEALLPGAVRLGPRSAAWAGAKKKCVELACLQKVPASHGAPHLRVHGNARLYRPPQCYSIHESLTESLPLVLGAISAKSWTVQNDVPTGFNLYRMASGPTAIVAVGDACVMLRSLDQGGKWVRPIDSCLHSLPPSAILLHPP